MLTHEKIVEVVKKAVNEFPLTRAEHFGSYADGYATEESDLDLLVECTEPAISILTIISLKHFLEEELAKSVDVIHVSLPEDSNIEIGGIINIL